MSSNDAVLSAILDRRSASAKHLTAPGPDAATLERMVFLASRAPDHGRLVPFRFIAIGPETLDHFADVLGAATRETDPTTSEHEIERAREKAFQGPCLLGMVARIDGEHPKIPAPEQWLSAGCALENLLLAVQALGFAAAVRSGRYLDAEAVRKAFKLGANEHFVSFIAIGTPSEWPPAKPKPDMAKVFSRWNP